MSSAKALGPSVDELLRRHAPQVLGQLVRRHGQFDLCEDAVQEALLAASQSWPAEGVPDRPGAWLSTVASRRLTDIVRAEAARRRREATAAAGRRPDDLVTPGPEHQQGDRDDTLDLLFLCCAPPLTPESQVALTLRAVGGLTTAQVAAAFMVPEATMTRRISRAKRALAGATLGPLTVGERARRLPAVLHVLYLIFNEGYTATDGADLQRLLLAAEAVRLTRVVHRMLPDDGEVSGLLALMLLTDARRPARSTDDGALVPLARQDRTRWITEQITEGIALLTQALPRSLVGPYQVQAAIAAVHAEAQRAEDTDWTQITALYALLDRLAPSPVVTLNRAVAVAMTSGPAAGLAMLDALGEPGAAGTAHRLSATRAHLLEMLGESRSAQLWYETAGRQTTSLPEQRYLRAQAARLSPQPASRPPSLTTATSSSPGPGTARAPAPVPAR